jgi:NitT/TauT family transport system substrate-binding protein
MKSLETFTASRRDFLSRTCALGAATLLAYPRGAYAEPPPETTKLRLVHGPFVCFAPLYLAEELLRLEGFSEIEYVKIDGTIPATLASLADLAMFGGPSVIPPIDAGVPVVALTGIHIGCWELFVNEHVNAIRDLKGKAIAVIASGSVEHVWISSIMAYVGMDPRTDINWVKTGKLSESQRLFLEGKVDAFLAFPPQPQEVRAKKVGKVILNTTLDRPWSQYFCCMLAGNRNFVESHPVATKRALRAILKATDLCARDPHGAARFLAAKGYEPRYDMSLEILRSLPYDQWRARDPSDTLRFHALRLHEVGMIKSTPQKIIEQGTDWRFLNELKRELKA